MAGGEETVLHLDENKPDIVLLDINLKGKLDDIETAKQMQLKNNIPIIYLTANSDEATFNRAKPTRPFAFISKPFKQLDLQRAIELTISRMAGNENPITMIKLQTMSSRIFKRPDICTAQRKDGEDIGDRYFIH